MKRINIKGTVNQKNMINGIVYRGGGGGHDESDEKVHILKSIVYFYEQKELPIDNEVV